MNSKKTHRAEFYRKLLCHVKGQLGDLNTFCFVWWSFARVESNLKSTIGSMKKKEGTGEHAHSHVI